MVNVVIHEILDEPALRQVWPVMQQLRPHLSEQEFIDLLALMRPEGFRIAAVFDDDVCVAVAGFRIQHYLHRGKNLYVDDLVTDTAHHGRGYGKAMLDWLKQEAAKHGCDNVHLDSGTQRLGAHAFYFAQAMKISAFHFIVDIKKTA